MRKFHLSDFMKSATAFGLVSATGIDAWLYVADKADLMDVAPGLYLTGPVAAWGLLSIPLSISLGERLVNAAYKRPGKITPLIATEVGSTSRAIPWNKPTGPTTLLAHLAPSIFGPSASPPVPVPDRPRRVAWQVPIDDGWVLVNEVELARFLELCERRSAHKFSYRYWTKKRRPAMPRRKYYGVMTLLESAGLIEARTAGASGWLINGLKPHNAVSYLKFESEYRI